MSPGRRPAGPPPSAGVLAFGRPRNRSLLGMTDYTLMAQHVDARRAGPETPEELMRFLARTPILALDGARPIELTLAAFTGP